MSLNPRVAVSSLLDLESKYNRAIEEKTLLEQEVIQRQELEEECQRLKDDVRGESCTQSGSMGAHARRQY
jgi:nuclear distribution protein NudE